MSKPIIENMRTWPRNLSTSQGGGLSTSQYGGLSTSQYGGIACRVRVAGCRHIALSSGLFGILANGFANQVLIL